VIVDTGEREGSSGVANQGDVVSSDATISAAIYQLSDSHSFAHKRTCILTDHARCE
jgi:hypothetical protein